MRKFENLTNSILKVTFVSKKKKKKKKMLAEWQTIQTLFVQALFVQILIG